MEIINQAGIKRYAANALLRPLTIGTEVSDIDNEIQVTTVDTCGEDKAQRDQ